MRQPVDEIRAVCYVGAGTMGCVNSLVAAVSGYEAVLYDVDPAMLEQAPDRQRGFADYMVATGYCTEDEAADAFDRIRMTTDPSDAAAHADLVSESVVERLDVKRSVHRQFDELCPPGTILTTNTSALLVSEIEDAVQRGERFAALHSHLGSTLVDIVPGPRTSPETMDVLRRYALSLGATPLVLKREHPGYIVNALLGPFLMGAVQLVARGHFDVETVDAAWMAYRGAPMGPFALMDLFGLDLVVHNWENPSADDNDFRVARRAEAIPLVKPIVDRGDYGMKTGKGFYEYPEPAYERAGFLDLASAAAHRCLVTAVLMRAALIADDGVAEPHDIDRAWMTATSLDIGPFGLIDELGAAGFRDTCGDQLAAGLTSDDEAQQVGRFMRSRDSGFYEYPDPAFRHPEFLHPDPG